jgi:uncharacterized protein (TIGR02246 family)
MKLQLHAIAFISFFLAISVPIKSQTLDKKHSKDIADLQQFSLDIDSAWNSHNAAVFSELFLDDADFQYWNGYMLNDRKQIEQYYSTKVFKNTPSDIRHKGTIQNIRFLGPKIAIGDGKLVIAKTGAPENEKPIVNVLFTCVAKKYHGQWRIAALRLMFPTEQKN